LGTYVPYSGATGAVDLGDESLTTTSTGTFGNVATDFYNASDGSTNLMSWDSGNAEIDVSQNMSLVDDSYLKLGTGHDADIYFDGSKLVIKVT